MECVKVPSPAWWGTGSGIEQAEGVEGEHFLNVFSH